MEKVLVDDDISLYELGLPIRDGAIKKSIIALPSNALSAEGIRTKADKGIATIDAIRIANLLSGVKDTSDTGL